MSLPDTLPLFHQDTCYPREPEAILEWFEQTLMNVNDSPEAGPCPDGLIAPHIDFRVNLDCYAQAYSPLLHSTHPPDRILLLGVGHRCPHQFSAHPFSLGTPWGALPADRDAYHFLTQHSGLALSRSPETFLGEHSLEFAAVWLEAVRQMAFPDTSWPVLPILCSGCHEELFRGIPPTPGEAFYRLGESLRDWVREAGQVLIIASIDGCHVGPRFDHLFRGNQLIQKAVARWENDLWNQAHHQTFDSFFHHLADALNPFYFDGAGVLTLLLQHQNLECRIAKNECWFEEADQSFVTFSAGTMSVANG